MMTGKRQFIGAQEVDEDEIKKLREDGGFIMLDQVKISTACGTTFVFNGLTAFGPSSSGRKREVNHSVAVGVGGTLQVIGRERLLWYGNGPLEYDEKSGEMRNMILSSQWSIARVFSPSYWQEVKTLDYVAWQEKNTVERHFATKGRDTGETDGAEKTE